MPLHIDSMKNGCLFALAALFGICGSAMFAAAILNAMFPSLRLNVEGIGSIASYPAWGVAIWLFIYGYRKEKRAEAARPKPPENLRPIDYSSLGKPTSKGSEDKRED